MVLLSGNNFSGSLPGIWTRLTNIKVLDVSNNQLTAQLPPTYVSLRRLVILDASNNKLNGSIPQLWDFMAGPEFQLRCLSLFGNDDMPRDEVARRKESLKQASGGRISVLVSPPPQGSAGWCGITLS
jgi:hypothetical protein